MIEYPKNLSEEERSLGVRSSQEGAATLTQIAI